MKKNQKIIVGVGGAIAIAAATILAYFFSKRNKKTENAETEAEDFTEGPDGKPRYSKRGAGGRFVKKNDQAQA